MKTARNVLLVAAWVVVCYLTMNQYIHNIGADVVYFTRNTPTIYSYVFGVFYYPTLSMPTIITIAYVIVMFYSLIKGE
jgi:hypothetical protein